MRTVVKALDAKLGSGDVEAAAVDLKATLRRVDKVAAKGAIKVGTAARIKSRLQRKVNKAGAGKES